jgi:sec-independent protein translocase protein TatA
MREIFTPGHMLLIAVVALIFFGPAKLPELGRGFGKMLREFKSGAKGIMGEDEAVESKHVPPAEVTNVPKYVEAIPVQNKRQLP